MKKRLFLVFAALTFMSCNLLTPQSTPIATPSIPPSDSLFTATAQALATATKQPAASTPAPAVEPNPNLASFTVNTSRPFYDHPLLRWEPQPYPGQLDALPIKLETLDNPAVIAGLSAEQRALLANNGFTVLRTQEQQFADIRLEVAELSGQTYYLTTDAAFHALHINFDELLKALEREQFRPQMIALTQALLEQTQAYQQDTRGTSLEADAQLAVAYLTVALQLFDPQTAYPRELAALVDPQVKQILAAVGREQSSLLPDFEDDYAAYKPAGHYATHPDLETYFRGMTWLGRVAFVFKDIGQPQHQPSRAPLIITLALREASLEQGQPAAAAWGDIHEMLTFLIGPSDNPGPLELTSLMDAVYGPGLSIDSLADDSLWQSFLQRVDELPAPQINSSFVSSTQALQASRDWRLMGQRFTLDGMILQNMVFDKVGTQAKPRKLPSGLDVMAAFGSPAALTALKQSGESEYENYLSQLEKMQGAVQAQPESEWLMRFASGWLYSFIPQIGIKNEAYPPYMRSSAWNDKALNSALGSWAELKHDTVLYTKMPEFMGGGGPPSSGPAPAYVEPNPDVFYRLSYLALNLAEGLGMRGMDSSPQGDPNDTTRGVSLDRLVAGMRDLGSQFGTLGDIATRELQGQTPNEDERYTITSCLGLIECDDTILPEQPPVPVVAAVAGADNQVLEVAVGAVDRIYVVIPVDGRLQVAQGGVFSYFEFSQPRSARLTDEEWRQRLDSSPPARPAWTESYTVPGGEARLVLAFRVGDIYIITEEGGSPPLNVRAEPSSTASVKGTLAVGAYIRIVDGPVQSGGKTWWKIAEDFGNAAGWVAENPAWYERAHGQ